MAEARVSRLIVQALASANGGVSFNNINRRGVSTSASASASTSTSSSVVFVVDRSESVVRLNDSHLAGVSPEVLTVKRKRGRPPRNPASAAAVATVSSSKAAVAVAASKRSKEEEDVCFICFDGGSLVLCDRRDCPKAYHPACVKRDESFFRPNIRWDCGWHFCNSCQRNALFLCYTCQHSFCKRCVKQVDMFIVRGNKGFCKTCMTMIMQIEKIPQENKDVVHVDFDDTANWEYLFKMYWIYLKEKENLTLDELTRASNPYKVSGLEDKDIFRDKTYDPCISNASELSDNSKHWEANVSKRRKTGRQQQSLYVDSQNIDKAESNKVSGQPDWASKELLEFVAYMKNGDTSAVPQFDVQALLLDYIRKNNLRDPRQKCQIICDKRLEKLFGKDRVGHFEMLKLLEYHFKEESRTNSMIRGASVDPFSGQVEGSTVEMEIPSRETRWPSRRKGDDKGRQINLDGFAAIDGHNINLIYLKRGLLETLTGNAENFHDKVVGSVVRIKISSSDQKQEMHRLVRIIGTSKASMPYKIGGKMENLMLKILNLNKIEDVSIDAISDQEFSEDECRRLRQSIKLGLVERLTVGDIQKKATSLLAVRVDHWLETEIRKLNLLRDRANEMGHRKEHREYVEKIELLQTPEERHRRIHEVPEVHADPRMDPSYGSDDDSGESDVQRRDVAWTPKYSKSYAKSMESNSPLKVEDLSKDDKAKTWKASTVNGTRKRKCTTKSTVNGALGSSKSAQKTERANVASKVVKIENDHGVTANGSISQAKSDASMLNSRGMLLASDTSEIEKTWHYRDPAGNVQGPFCLLQLRKWDSSGFFPNDLRVWKTNETYDQSTLLTDALRKQQSIEPHLQSPDGAKFDDEKVNSTGQMSSNSVASSIGNQTNEECSKSNSTDIASTPDANEQPVNGYSCPLDSNGQISVKNFNAQLIDSLFNTEEPSPDASVNRSPEMMHVDLKSDNVDVKCQEVKSAPCSPDAGRPEPEIMMPMACSNFEASDISCSIPNSNYETKSLTVDNEIHVKSDACNKLFGSCGTGSGGINVSDLLISPPLENKTIKCHEQDSRVSSTISGGINVSVLPSAAQRGDDQRLRSYITENRHSISANILGGDSGTSWNTVSCGTDVSLQVNEDININNSSIPEQDSSTTWHTISGRPMIETDNSKAPITENEGTTTSTIPEQDSRISWSNMAGEIVFSDVAIPTLKLEADASRGVPPQIMHRHDPSINWSSSTGIGDEVHLPDVADEWGMYSNVHVKPSIGEFNSSLVSCSSVKLAEVQIDHATPISDSCQLTPCSPNDQSFDISNWQPIELNTLGDDSVSDLLSEVEAMESLRNMSSLTSMIDCGDDLIGFSPLGGSSPNIDPVKNDALNSTTEMQFHLLPSPRDQLHDSFHVDICDIPRTSCILPTLGLQVESEVKPIISSMPPHNFGSVAPVLSLPPPPPSPPPLVPPHRFVFEVPLSSLAPPRLPSPPQAVPSTVSQADDKLPSSPYTTIKSPSPIEATKSPSLPCPATPVAEKLFSPPYLPPVAEKSLSPPQLPPVVEKSLSPPQVPPVSEKLFLPPQSPPVAEKLFSPPHLPPVAEKSLSPPQFPPVAEKSLSLPQSPVSEKSLLPPQSPPAAEKLFSPSHLPPVAEQSLSPPQLPPLSKKSLSPPQSPISSEKSLPPPQSPSVVEKPSSPAPQPPSNSAIPPPPPMSADNKIPSPPPPPPIAEKLPSSPPPPPPIAEKLSSPPQLPSVVEKPSSLAPQPPSDSAMLPPPPTPLSAGNKLPSPPPPPPIAGKLPSPPQLPSVVEKPSSLAPQPPSASVVPPSPPPPPPPPTLSAGDKLPSLPQVAEKLPPPPPPPFAGNITLPPAPPTGVEKLPSPSAVKKRRLPPPLDKKLPTPPPLTSTRLNFPSSPQEEGEVEPPNISARHHELASRNQRPQPTATAGNSRKHGFKPITNNGWELPGQPNGKIPGTSSILGSPNVHWTNSGQVMPSISANPHWNTSVANQGSRVSQTSPRYSHNVGRHPGPKDRTHNHHGVDLGFGKNRPTSWSRQPSFGGAGVPLRPPLRGQRVCKFYESGYCKKGASSFVPKIEVRPRGEKIQPSTSSITSSINDNGVAP